MVVDHVVKNGKASDVELTEEDVAEIDQTLASCKVARERYHSADMRNHQLLELRSLFSSSIHSGLRLSCGF